MMEMLNFGKLAKYFSESRSESEIVPVIMQDISSGDIYTLAYASKKALLQTLSTGLATFWSTSRNELWIKGATSGNTFEVIDILFDCEGNSLLYKVKPNKGGACHYKDEAGRNYGSCFRQKLNLKGELQ